MLVRLTLLGLVVLAASFVGCEGKKETSTPTGDAKVYDIKGKVVSIDSEKKKITLDHEDIPGLMKAMTMPFGVEDEKLLTAVKPGDAVHGKLKVQDGKYVLTSLAKP